MAKTIAACVDFVARCITILKDLTGIVKKTIYGLGTTATATATADANYCLP